MALALLCNGDTESRWCSKHRRTNACDGNPQNCEFLRSEVDQRTRAAKELKKATLKARKKFRKKYCCEPPPGFDHTWNDERLNLALR